METVPCPHCNAPVRPTATFCLACDTPLADIRRGGLSVADGVPVQGLFRVVGIGVGLALLLVLGGAGFGMYRLYDHAQSDAAGLADAAVNRSVRLLVEAESGRAAACHELRRVSELQRVDGASPETLSGQCRALVGRDASARLETMSIASLRISEQSHSGTARVLATIQDPSGTHRVDRTLDVVRKRDRSWVVAWDGRPLL